MTDIAERMGPLSVDQTGALIAELLRRTPGGKLSQSQIAEAIATVGDLYSAAATLELWKAGKVEFGWDSEESELVLCSTEIDSETPADGRLIWKGK